MYLLAAHAAQEKTRERGGTHMVKKRILALLLAVVLVGTLLPAVTLAELLPSGETYTVDDDTLTPEEPLEDEEDTVDDPDSGEENEEEDEDELFPEEELDIAPFSLSSEASTTSETTDDWAELKGIIEEAISDFYFLHSGDASSHAQTIVYGDEFSEVKREKKPITESTTLTAENIQMFRWAGNNTEGIIGSHSLNYYELSGDITVILDGRSVADGGTGGFVMDYSANSQDCEDNEVPSVIYTGLSPITLAEDANVTLVIRGTVELHGADGVGTYAGTPAIAVPSSATLTIVDWDEYNETTDNKHIVEGNNNDIRGVSDHTLKVYGGNAADGSNGTQGVMGDADGYLRVGGGGNGGGGAAAAIGTAGGKGGAGAERAKIVSGTDKEVKLMSVNGYNTLCIAGFSFTDISDMDDWTATLIDEEQETNLIALHPEGVSEGDTTCVRGTAGTQASSAGNVRMVGHLNLVGSGGSAAAGGQGGEGTGAFIREKPKLKSTGIYTVLLYNGDSVDGSEFIKAKSDVVVGGFGGGGGGGGGCAAPFIGNGGAGGSGGSSGGVGKTTSSDLYYTEDDVTKDDKYPCSKAYTWAMSASSGNDTAAKCSGGAGGDGGWPNGSGGNGGNAGFSQTKTGTSDIYKISKSGDTPPTASLSASAAAGDSGNGGNSGNDVDSNIWSWYLTNYKVGTVEDYEKPTAGAGGKGAAGKNSTLPTGSYGGGTVVATAWSDVTPVFSSGIRVDSGVSGGKYNNSSTIHLVGGGDGYCSDGGNGTATTSPAVLVDLRDCTVSGVDTANYTYDGDVKSYGSTSISITYKKGSDENRLIEKWWNWWTDTTNVNKTDYDFCVTIIHDNSEGKVNHVETDWTHYDSTNVGGTVRKKSTSAQNYTEVTWSALKTYRPNAIGYLDIRNRVTIQAELNGLEVTTKETQESSYNVNTPVQLSYTVTTSITNSSTTSGYEELGYEDFKTNRNCGKDPTHTWKVQKWDNDSSSYTDDIIYGTDYTWTEGENTTAGQPTFVPKVAGKYRITLSLSGMVNYKDYPGESGSVTALVLNVTGEPKVEITGATGETVHPGTTLTANVTNSSELTGVTLNYQWYRTSDSGVEKISGAAGKTYQPLNTDLTRQLQVEVFYTLDGTEVKNRSAFTNPVGHTYLTSGNNKGFCNHTSTDSAGNTVYCEEYQPADWDAANNRYSISNAGQLFWFAALVNGDSTHAHDAKGNALAANLNANAVLADSIKIKKDQSGNIRYWTPIANSATVIVTRDKTTLEVVSRTLTNAYTGTFTSSDNRNKSISGMFINGSKDCMGLFAAIGNGAEVSKVSFTISGQYIEDEDKTKTYNYITVNGYSYVGGLVGYADEGSAVKNCTVVNLIILANEGTESSDVNCIGGAIGYARNATVTNLTAGDTARGDNNTLKITEKKPGPDDESDRIQWVNVKNVGGLIGALEDDNGNYFGELKNVVKWGIVIDVYSGTNVGGLVGYAKGNGDKLTLQVSSPGAVDITLNVGGQCVGGIVGYMEKVSLYGSSYNSCSGTITYSESGQTDCWNESYTFDDDSDSSVVEDYEISKGIAVGGIAGYARNAELASVESLVAIDVNTNDNASNYAGAGNVGGIVGRAAGTTSITNATYNASIKGKYLAQVGGILGAGRGSGIVLRGCTCGSSEDNLATINVDYACDNIGGIVGAIIGSVTSCTSYAEITVSPIDNVNHSTGYLGGANFGGVAGTVLSNSAVSGCTSVGTITTTSLAAKEWDPGSGEYGEFVENGKIASAANVGGVVGYAQSATISNSSSSMTINYTGGRTETGTKSNTQTYPTYDDEGNETGTEEVTTYYFNYGSDVGGVAGFVKNCALSAVSYSGTMTVIGTGSGDKRASEIGGIVGAAFGTTTITEATSTATITGMWLKHVGGVLGVGRGNAIELTKCVFGTGDLSSGKIEVENTWDSVGGVAGAVAGDVKYCANRLPITVTAPDSDYSLFYVGGVVGQLMQTTQSTVNDNYTDGTKNVLYSCYNYGVITGTATKLDYYDSGDNQNNSPVAVGAVVGCYGNGGMSKYLYSLKETVNVTAKNKTITNGDRSCGKGFDTERYKEYGKREANYFVSGEVCWLLNKGDTVPVWKQTLTGSNPDAYPVFEGGTVYKMGEYEEYANSPATYSVDITWGSMRFIYSCTDWDPDNHKYASYEWEPVEEGVSNAVTITNKSTYLPVSAVVTFEDTNDFEEYALFGKFVGTDTKNSTTATIKEIRSTADGADETTAKAEKVCLNLGSENYVPTSKLAGAEVKVGTLTVTLSEVTPSSSS